MTLIIIPQHWKARIAADPDGEFARRAKIVVSRIETNNSEHTTSIQRRNQSQIGTRLAKKFKDCIGAIPCGACKQAIEALNRMTVSDVKQREAEIVAVIERNSRTATISWWARVVAYADDTLTDGKLTRTMIARWLHEACAMELADATNDETSTGLLADSGSDVTLGGDVAG